MKNLKNSRLAVRFMEENAVNWWKTPPESPDLYPIENLWHDMQHFPRNKAKPHTKEELVHGIARFRAEKVDATICTKYIDIGHLQSVLPIVGLLQLTLTWYKIRHAGRQAHRYSRTGTSKQRQVKPHWFTSLRFNIPVRE